MAKAKMIGKGTVVKVDVVNVATAIGMVYSISGPNPTAETYDGSTLDQSGDGKPKPVTGYVDSGECTIEMFFDAADTTDQELLDLALGTTSNTSEDGTNWSITYANADVMSWTGGGVSFNQTIAMNDGVKATITVVVNGNITAPS